MIVCAAIVCAAIVCAALASGLAYAETLSVADSQAVVGLQLKMARAVRAAGTVTPHCPARDADGSESEPLAAPARDSAVGLSRIAPLLKKKAIVTLADFVGLYGGIPLPLGLNRALLPAAAQTRNLIVGKNGNELLTSYDGVRYLYSPVWGWLDLAHFAGAAFTAEWLEANVGSDKTAARISVTSFQDHEGRQTSDSRFTYEDLPSNLMGAGFFLYMKKHADKNRSLVELLPRFLSDLGFVEDPIRAAPNGGRLPERDSDIYPQDAINHPTPRNFTYMPAYTSLCANPRNETERDLVRFRDSYRNVRTR